MNKDARMNNDRRDDYNDTRRRPLNRRPPALCDGALSPRAGTVPPALLPPGQHGNRVPSCATMPPVPQSLLPPIRRTASGAHLWHVWHVLGPAALSALLVLIALLVLPAAARAGGHFPPLERRLLPAGSGVLPPPAAQSFPSRFVPAAAGAATAPAARPDAAADAVTMPEAGQNAHEPSAAAQDARNEFAAGSFTAQDYWHLDSIGAAAAHEISRGDGIIVIVIDTGVDTDHPDLAASLRLDLARNFGDADDPANVEDQLGHGTTMTGLVLQVAPAAAVVPLKINPGGDNYFTNEALEAALVYAAELAAADPARVRVVNLSLVVDEGDFGAITAELDALAALDVVVTAAAGNGGAGQLLAFPACLAATVAVTATAADDLTAGFARRGPALTVAAPGVDLYGPSLGGWFYISGTSPAAALTAGALANLAAAVPGRRLAAAEMLRALLAGSVDLHTPGHDEDSGFGRLDLAAATAEAAGSGIYFLPAAVLLSPGEQRTILFAADIGGGASLSWAGNGAFAVMDREPEAGRITIRAMQPGRGTVTVRDAAGGRRDCPVSVVEAADQGTAGEWATSGADDPANRGAGEWATNGAAGGFADAAATAYRAGIVLYPCCAAPAAPAEYLYGWYTLQGLTALETDGCWWLHAWSEDAGGGAAGYRVALLAAWNQAQFAAGCSFDFLFPAVRIADLPPGICEMGLYGSHPDFAGQRVFFVK
ncbi:MAG: S8 family serine peptidase [Deltaproteobacteria bacterium]|nr:S8 family serine peptidase [Candidatus Anaeroferrophillacea bacterium]